MSDLLQYMLILLLQGRDCPTILLHRFKAANQQKPNRILQTFFRNIDTTKAEHLSQLYSLHTFLYAKKKIMGLTALILFKISKEPEVATNETYSVAIKKIAKKKSHFILK